MAWRIGLPLTGIGLPGHYIVGAPGGILVDPAGDGRRLTPDDCQALIRRVVGDGVLFHSRMLRPTGKRETLTREDLDDIFAAHELREGAHLGLLEQAVTMLPPSSEVPR